jgi:hypothetical protein
MLGDSVYTIKETETVVINTIEQIVVPVVEIETETVVIADKIQSDTIVVEIESESIVVINDGFKGDVGASGIGVPAGGTTGQRLVKKTGTDYDTEWQTQPPAPPSGADKQLQFNDGGVPGIDPNIRWNKNSKTLEIGVPVDVTFPSNPVAAMGFVDDYYQVVINNQFEGLAASSDFVATADNGDDDNFYIDLGINSSIYDQPDYDAYKANDGYLYVNGGNLILNAETVGKRVKIAVGGSKQENIVAEFSETQLKLPQHYAVTNRPEIFYGSGSPPDPTGLLDGTLFIRYQE